jgi:mono/diheme cytochrome c family protein
MKQTIIILTFALLGHFVKAQGTSKAPSPPWIVPEANVKKPNPVKADAKSIAAGKVLFAFCATCHGKTGLGNGTQSPDLKTKPGNFTKPEFQSQTDGAIFYKMSEGRGEMKPMKHIFPKDTDRWNLVNYLRTLTATK